MFQKVITSSKFAKKAGKHNPLADWFSKQHKLSLCTRVVFLGLIVFLKPQLAIKDHVLIFFFFF